MKTKRHVAVFLWLAILATPAMALPLVAGQITAADGVKWRDIVISRDGREHRAHEGEYLYAHDSVSLHTTSGSAAIEAKGGDTIDIPYFPQSTEVPPPPDPSVLSFEGLERLMNIWPALFTLHHEKISAPTTPNGQHGGHPAPLPTTFLPLVTQTVAASRHQGLPLVWIGGVENVTLVDDQGSVLVGDRSKIGGFIDFDCPPLDPGRRYELRVGSGEDAIVFPLYAVERPDPASDDLLLKSVQALKGPAENRLQALADLEQLQQSGNYVAYATLRAISQDNFP